MAKKTLKDLNTSCKITSKDGVSKTYKDITTASKLTGLTINSIKLRCNKPGSSGKDGMICEWLDDYTKRYYKAKQSKHKGNGWETEIVNNLLTCGYNGCVRAASESKNSDLNKIDIVDTKHELPINIQAKNTTNLPNYFKIRDACSDKEKPFCLAWKKASTGGHASPGAVMLVPIDFFYELLTCYKSMTNNNKND